MDYKKIEKCQYDAQQYILNTDGSIFRNPIKCAKITLKAEYDTIIMCPFCLSTLKLAEFRFSEGLRVCSHCNNKMRLETLLKINSIEEFAKFVFNYRFNGFWQKIKPSFKQWNKNLYLLGLSKEFWEHYHRLKGDTKKDYEE